MTNLLVTKSELEKKVRDANFKRGLAEEELTIVLIEKDKLDKEISGYTDTIVNVGAELKEIEEFISWKIEKSKEENTSEPEPDSIADEIANAVIARKNSNKGQASEVKSIGNIQYTDLDGKETISIKEDGEAKFSGKLETEKAIMTIEEGIYVENKIIKNKSK